MVSLFYFFNLLCPPTHPKIYFKFFNLLTARRIKFFCKFENNKIKINSSQYFDNVSEEVYNYSIGGYKPIEKYIKARETLTLNDIMHIQKVISVIEKTIEIQKSIDGVYMKIDN
ncbi:type ISP restriction/modification enzyme [Brachyspira sp.]|uniref:type ISP restriction/modification enzyme n=1 Tax=Brachyspira sp. TaxID=1977261 RepID=UPI002635A432|nr:type ISP restriction/modification enzyme [Brachyspira sp.]